LPCIRYGEAMLLIAALHDDLLAQSLRDTYLAPLRDESDGGKRARETLLAYFSVEQHASATAALLGVSRRTVTSRLRAIEAAFGGQVVNSAAEIMTALELDEMDRS
jgi:DNA-binding PucR family transcriptional regulator